MARGPPAAIMAITKRSMIRVIQQNSATSLSGLVLLGASSLSFSFELKNLPNLYKQINDINHSEGFGLNLSKTLSFKC
ncbi:MAG: hypothetical protein PVI03_02990 [Candidatus Thorarchaeota archaeon]